MTEETPLLVRVEALPERNGCGDEGCPRQLSSRPSRSGAGASARCARGLRAALRALDRRRLEVSVASRRLSAPGQRDDLAAVTRSIERQNQVNHGKPGANEQCVAAGCSEFFDCGPRFGSPRIGDESLPCPLKRTQSFRLLVPDSQGDRCCLQRSSCRRTQGTSARPSRCARMADQWTR